MDTDGLQAPRVVDYEITPFAQIQPHRHAAHSRHFHCLRLEHIEMRVVLSR